MKKFVTDGEYWTNIFEATNGSQHYIRTNDTTKVV